MTPESMWKDILKDKQRTKVIMMNTALDYSLAALVSTAFSRKDKEVQGLFNPTQNGPLNTLPKKAGLAYALNLIDKTTLQDLKNLHAIRNRFAHSIRPDFNDPEIKKRTKKLSTFNNQEITADNYLDFHDRAIEKCDKYIREKYHEIAEETHLLRAARHLSQT
jgi:DNA-binding MltR family transcriptional regulator